MYAFHYEIYLSIFCIRNGIRPGDVVTQVNGQNVYSAIDIQKLLEKEDVLDIIVLRSDKKIKCKVPLVETVMP